MSERKTVEWSVEPFAALSTLRLHAILQLRVDVFVVEQRCIYAEVDGKDPAAHHVQGHDLHGELVAYARILPPGADGSPHIGRVVVHPSARAAGLGIELMGRTLDAVERIHGSRRSALAAQSYLQGFYSSLGFVRVSDEYDWDGIPHVDMVLSATG